MITHRLYVGMKISLGGSKKTTAVKPKPKPKPSALFEEEEEDEQDQPSPADALAMTLRQRSTSRSKVQQKLEQALQEDPSVFDYDDVLPQLTNDRKRVQEAKKARSASTKVTSKLTFMICETLLLII